MPPVTSEIIAFDLSHLNNKFTPQSPRIKQVGFVPALYTFNFDLIDEPLELCRYSYTLYDCIYTDIFSHSPIEFPPLYFMCHYPSPVQYFSLRPTS